MYLCLITCVLVIIMSPNMARVATNKSSKRRQQETSTLRAIRSNGPVVTSALSVPQSSRETLQIIKHLRVRSPTPLV